MKSRKKQKELFFLHWKKITCNSGTVKCFKQKGLEKFELKQSVALVYTYVCMFKVHASVLSKNKLKDVKSDLTLLTKIYLKYYL